MDARVHCTSKAPFTARGRSTRSRRVCAHSSAADPSRDVAIANAAMPVHHASMPDWEVLSVAERLDAHRDYAGKGVCIGFIDLGFYAHPDLMRPERRIRSYVDVT